LQDAVERQFVDAIEDLVGRRVISFMSASDPVRDHQLEAFVLERVVEEVPRADL
jgi:uncharacterized protein YbcI